jgi:hypothetical protein
MSTPPIMPFIALVLLALPVRLSPRRLAWLAFALWILGGAVLCSLGTSRLLQAEKEGVAPGLIALGAVISLAIGIAKGRFLLSKTASRNIERLGRITENLRPFRVYGARSWIVISLMAAISLALNLGGVPPFWRGAVNLAIGAALVTSSLNYLTNPRVRSLRSV